MEKVAHHQSSSREKFLLFFAADVSLVAAPDELLPLVELHRGVAEHQNVAREQDAQGAGMNGLLHAV